MRGKWGGCGSSWWREALGVLTTLAMRGRAVVGGAVVGGGVVRGGVARGGVALVLACGLTIQAGAQPAGATGVEAGGGEEGRGGAVVTGVDELHARTAQQLAESWVWRGGVPGQRAEPVRARGVLGVRVTLRLAGRTVGQSTRVRPDLADYLQAVTENRPPAEADPRGLDVVTLLEPAVTEALREAVQSVSTQRRRGIDRRSQADAAAGEMDGEGEEGGAEPAASSAPDDTTGRWDAVDPTELGPQLGVDLQLAYELERVVRLGLPGESVYWHFAPSFHGLLASRGGEAAWVWPGTAVASNLSPDRQVLRLLTQLGLQPGDDDQLGVTGGAALYRFEVLHLVRPRAAQPVLGLVRGGQLLPARFVDQATLGNMADRIGLHLFGRFLGDGRVRGTYAPSRGIYQTPLADDREATLASYALVRLVDRKRQDRSLDGIVESYVTLARQVVDRVLLPLGEDGGEAVDTVAAAFSLLTMLHSPAGTFDPAQRTAVAELLQRRIDDTGRVRAARADAEAAPGSAPGSSPTAEPGSTAGGGSADGGAGEDASAVLPAAAEAAVLAALAELYPQTRDPDTGAAVASLMDSLWTRTDGRFDVNALPWVAAAQDAAGPLLVDDGRIPADLHTQRQAQLAELLRVLGELQIVQRPALGPPDVLGGIIVQPAPEGSAPNPTWTTAPLFMFMALMIRDQDAVDAGQRRGALLTVGGAARFLGQLMVDEPQTFAMTSPDEATGGIRLSLWDNRLDIAPSAMTLLGLLEWRTTAQALAGEPEAGGNPGDASLQDDASPGEP